MPIAYGSFLNAWSNFTQASLFLPASSSARPSKKSLSASALLVSMSSAAASRAIASTHKITTTPLTTSLYPLPHARCRVVAAACRDGPRRGLVSRADRHDAAERGSADRRVGRGQRSEERRVGKECRSRWSAYHSRKKI